MVRRIQNATARFRVCWVESLTFATIRTTIRDNRLISNDGLDRTEKRQQDL